MPRALVGQTSTAHLLQESTQAGNSTSGTSTLSVYNPGGSNTILIICAASEDSNDANLPFTGITVNGSATGVVKALHSRDGSNDSNAEIWYKLNPAAGVNTIVGSTTGSVFKGLVATVVEGLAQQAPEVTASSQGTAQTIASAVTPLSNFAFIVQCASHKPSFSSVVAPSALIGTTAGQSFEHCSASWKILDTAAATTMGQNWGSSSSYAQAIAVFAPVSNVVSRTLAAARTAAGTRTVASL